MLCGYKDPMFSTGSLVLFKAQLALVSAFSEGRISIELESGETKKVREKDISLLHSGPVSRIPPRREGGDFETAHAMLASDGEGREPIPTTWKELAELVFGEFSPASAAACARKAVEGALFGLSEDGPFALGLGEIDRVRRKAEEKLLEGARRSAFAAAMKEAFGHKDGSRPVSRQEFSRYIADLESFALGSGERCPAASDAGIAETREAVHQALVDSGLWEPCFNPWPARSGCVLWPPKLDFPESELPAFSAGRMDLRRLESFAIDNAWSNDPDDAIAIDGDTLWIHVADPAAFLAPDSSLDAEAISRGATLYIPEKVVPMLPPGAVARLGLGLEAESPALSFGVKLAGDGSPRETLITPSLVSVARLNYEEADALLASGHPGLASLDAFARLRHERRLANGAVDIDLPEVSTKAGNGEIRFVSVQPTRSSEIVREMMLLAGEAAARWAYERKIPFTYSSQEAPQIPRNLPRSDEEAGALSLQYQRRKGMKASIVGTECLAHQGLGLSFYSQVTSPLRRYQDLLAHYQIRAFLAAEDGVGASRSGGKAPDLLSPDEVSRRCILAAQGASSTRQAERDSRLHWIACFLSRNQDWKGEARVLDLRERDAWIIIPSLGLETSMRTKMRLSPDDIVQVKASRISIALHDITFEPVA